MVKKKTNWWSVSFPPYTQYICYRWENGTFITVAICYTIYKCMELYYTHGLYASLHKLPWPVQ